MSVYLQRARVGAVTQSLQASLQGARAEAIRRNQQVDFISTNLSVASSAVANAPSPAAAGQNWLVRAPVPAASGTFEMLDARSAAEGSPGGGAPGVEVQASGAYAGTVSFDGFGRTVGSVAYQLNVVHVASGCAASSPVACQSVHVSPGGKVATCAPFAAAGDSRACAP
jgi:Tfp pilus assembly protein FimT